MPEKELTLEDIILWIVNNSDDEDAMTKISLSAYPYSKKYKERYPDVVPDVHT